MRRGIVALLTLFLAFNAKGQNVGVGIAAPNDLFHVYGTTATMGILFNNVTTGSAAGDGLSITIDGGKNILFQQQESADMQFLTGGAVRMRIDKSGLVSINSAPSGNVQFLVSTATVNNAGLVGVGNGGSGSLPGLTGFGVLGSVGVGNPNVGVGGFYGGNVNIGSGGAGVFGSSKGTSGTSYGVYGTATGTATNIAGYFTASGGTNNYAVIIPSGGGSVGIGTNAPDASSILDLSGTATKGIMIPKVALTATNSSGPIASPATSLLVYNTATAGASPNNVTPGYYYNAGTPASPNWEQLLVSESAVSAGWLTTGNSGTTPGTFAAPGTNFLGTIDNSDFTIRTNNIERMRFATTGTIGINSAAATNYQLNVTNSAPSGKGLAGIYGTYLASGAGTGGGGVIGIGNGATFPGTYTGNVGVLGAVGSASGSAGLAGYAGPAGWGDPHVAGVYGESTLNTTPGVYGVNSAVASKTTSAKSGYGVYGSTNQNQSSGVYGNNNFGGFGVTGKSVSGSSSIYGNGVQGISDGNGVYGVSSAFGGSATNYAGVYGEYLPNTAATAVSGMAAVVGFNANYGFPSTYNGNIGVEGLYNVGGPGTYYGIGVLGLGYGSPSGPPPPMINSDFGVVGVVAGARTTSAAVAGYYGIYTAATYPVPAANAAIYGNSNSSANWALYGTNSAAAGKGLFVKGFSNLNGQVAINQATVPNSELQAVTNGYTYSTNQVTAIPIYAGFGGPSEVSGTGSVQFPYCQAGFNPITFRGDGDIQVQLVVYYTTTAGTNNFQLDANNGHPDAVVYPVTTSPAWTYASVGGGVTVATSPWTEWSAGTNAFQIHLEGFTGGSGTISVYNAYMLVRPMNN